MDAILLNKTVVYSDHEMSSAVSANLIFQLNSNDSVVLIAFPLLKC